MVVRLGASQYLGGSGSIPVSLILRFAFVDGPRELRAGLVDVPDRHVDLHRACC